MQQHGVLVPWFADDLERWSFGLVDEIGIEDVELWANQVLPRA